TTLWCTTIKSNKDLVGPIKRGAILTMAIMMYPGRELPTLTLPNSLRNKWTWKSGLDTMAISDIMIGILATPQLTHLWKELGANAERRPQTQVFTTPTN